MTMPLAEQKRHLAALGLPHLTAAQRKASWRVYQAASTWSSPPLYPDGLPGPLTSADVAVSARNGYRISPHFAIKEFRCKCGQVGVARELVQLLERVRERLYPGGLTIVSGYRCAKHNRAVGGASNSCHLSGLAADIPGRHKPSAFFGLGARGLGYKKRHGLVTHLDLRSSWPLDHVFAED